MTSSRGGGKAGTAVQSAERGEAHAVNAAANAAAQGGRGLAVVPEKNAMAHSVRSTIPAQYWGSAIASSSAADGAIALGVGDPAPLTTQAGSGLSRPHLVLAAQAVKLPGRPSLPGLPSLCGDQGGVVLDRVLVHSAGENWWGVLTGRAKLGKLAAERSDPRAALLDPGSYAMCANTRLALGRSMVLRTRADWCPASRSAAADPRTGPDAPPLSLSAALRSSLGPGAEARADLAVHQRAAAGPHAGPGLQAGADGAGGGGAPGCSGQGPTTPLLLGLQAGTPAASGSPVVWRCGVLQVVAPPTTPLGGTSSQHGAQLPNGGEDLAAGSRRAGWMQQQESLQTAVYVQGTAALQGQHTLYRAALRPKSRRAAAAPAASDAAAAAAGGSSLPPAPGLGPHNPLRQALTSLLPGGSGSRHRGGRGASRYDKDEPSGSEDGDGNDAVPHGNRAASGAGAASSGAGRKGTSRAGSGAASSGGSSKSSGAGGDGLPAPASGGKADAGGKGSGGGGKDGPKPPLGVELPSAGQVQESLMDVTQSISRLRDDVTQATRWVGSGGLAEQLGEGGGGGGRGRARQPRTARPSAPSPWSAFVGPPHLKVAGVVGVTARAPVFRLTPAGAARAAGAGGAPLRAVSEGGDGEGEGYAGEEAAGSAAALAGAHAAQQQQQQRSLWVQDFGLMRLARAAKAFVTAGPSGAAAGAAAGERRGGGAADGGAAAGCLRPFASGAVSVQAGRFSGWVLDFTRLTAKLDCGLWGPAVKGNILGGSPSSAPSQRHPAFALDDTGAWHCLTLSLSQQLLGPLRLGADWRYELSSPRPLVLPPLPRAPSAAHRDGGGGGAGGRPTGLPRSMSLNAAVAAAGHARDAAGWVPGASRSVVQHLSGMRPQLLDSALSLDLVVPGSEGAARLVAWYSPGRREGMLELRLF